MNAALLERYVSALTAADDWTVDDASAKLCRWLEEQRPSCFELTWTRGLAADGRFTDGGPARENLSWGGLSAPALRAGRRREADPFVPEGVGFRGEMQQVETVDLIVYRLGRKAPRPWPGAVHDAVTMAAALPAFLRRAGASTGSAARVLRAAYRAVSDHEQDRTLGDPQLERPGQFRVLVDPARSGQPDGGGVVWVRGYAASAGLAIPRRNVRDLPSADEWCVQLVVSSTWRSPTALLDASSPVFPDRMSPLDRFGSNAEGIV